MNWVDLIIVVIIALATFSSLRTGFLRQALTLVGFVVGLYTALSRYEALARALASAIGNSTVAAIIAFFVILVAVWFAFAVLATMAQAALKASGLAWADHFLGMLVGLLAGLFFTVCFLMLFIRIPFLGISDAIQQSVLASFIFRLLPHLRQLLPDDLRIFTVI